MNAIAPHQSSSLVPVGLDQAMRMADMMAKSKMLPEYFRGSPGDCLMIIEQAGRWNMSPLAVAQCCAKVKDKFCYEGKLIAAAVSSCGAIKSEFDYDFTGDPKNPQTLAVRASATRTSDGKVKHVDVAWKDARTNNEHWAKSPEQMLCYHAARVWARRWTPGVLLGVYAREEFDQQGNVVAEEPFTGTTIDGEHAQPEPVSDPPKKRTISEFLDDLQRQFDAAIVAGRDEVDRLIASEDVQKAQDRFTNGAKDRLIKMIGDAIARTDDDDGFPGQVTGDTAAA
jgi:hypothetical protein